MRKAAAAGREDKPAAAGRVRNDRAQGLLVAADITDRRVQPDLLKAAGANALPWSGQAVCLARSCLSSLASAAVQRGPPEGNMASRGHIWTPANGGDPYC